MNEETYLKELDAALEKIAVSLKNEHYLQSALLLGMLMGIVKQNIVDREKQKEEDV